MKLDTALEEMEIVLNELNEQFETIKKNEVRVPQIELDIIMGTMRRLYESMMHLNRQTPLMEVVKEITEVPVIINQEAEKTEEVVAETTVEEKVEESTIDIFEAETEDLSEELPEEDGFKLEAELAYEKVTTDFLEEKETEEEVIETPQAEIKEEIEIPIAQIPKTEAPKPSLLLQFEDEIFSVNESLAQKKDDTSLVNKLNNTRIENLKSAIGINDKFYFINELFSGNSQAYEDVIYTLNNFKRFEEAMQYTSTLKHRYDWSTETEAFQKLTHFLERKFVEIHA